MNENDKKRLNEAFGGVDEKYVAAAMTPPRRAHLTWGRIGIVAACLVLVIGAFFPIRNAVFMSPYRGGVTFVDTEQKGSASIVGAHAPSAPPRPWDDTLYLKGEVKTCSYKPGQPIELLLELGLNNDFTGGGAWRLTVKAPDFNIAVGGHECKEGVVIIDDATQESYSAERPLTLKVVLTPAYAESYAMGTITVSVGFVPDDEQALMQKIVESDVPDHYEQWQTAFFENGALRLGSTQLDYAADMVELRLDTSPRGAVDIWEIMIGQHYQMGKISGRELADMYYHRAYQNVIFASVTSYMEEEKTMRFSYMSQNIRYDHKEYIDDPVLWDFLKRAQAIEESGGWESMQSPEYLALLREEAEYILLYMKEQGIITAAEYEAEAAHMAVTEQVGNMQRGGLDQNLSRYRRVFRKYEYTH